LALAMRTPGAWKWVLRIPTGLPDRASRVSSASSSRRDSAMA
jgi:hypothetical protein